MLLYTCYRNVKSATGSNLRNIELEIEERINVEDLKKSINKIVERLHFAKTPEVENWKIDAMKEIALVKSGHMNLEGFSSAEVDEILRYISTQ